MSLRLTMIVTAATAVLLVASNHYRPEAHGTVDTGIVNPPPVPVPGAILRSEDVRFIDQPGRYGLGKDLADSRYAIVGGHLVRIDPDTMQVKSVLRRRAYASD
ncbi:hypothetical protein EYF88_00130 [Paracoccus sediminis]|uniref:Nickel/cobalt transporter regulator n=1 Tax=Paracoccus sediminis TaxID=1214787 RepID=A0A238UXI3_9RHOB|nr:hypothetical protein [Paracoccus sediminis]TBN52658.1 hypothetical protein EYF88_00130 [Paracoccus sediminis]SNR26890.1 hypothetical protein SAMN06265378_101595 [Paracoccus sediminis]